MFDCWWRIILFLFKIIEYGVSWVNKSTQSQGQQVNSKIVNQANLKEF